jgi:LPS-assembly protein
MIYPRVTFIVAMVFFVFCFASKGQQNPAEEGELISGQGSFSPSTGIGVFTNEVIIKYQGTVLTADRALVNEKTGETIADGNVRIQHGNQIWTGDHISYNYKTRQIATRKFRTGRPPVFAEGEGLSGDITNSVYNATKAFITTDDISDPAIKIRARHIRIIPGKRIEATHATLILGDVPIFYFPYYSRSLSARANNFNATPGYRSRFGPFILGTYTWFLNDRLDGELHLDYRQKRGIAGGPDLNFHFGRWGDGTIRYYYAHDQDPATNAALNAPVFENRERVYFSYHASPFTNLNVKSLVRYQNDISIVHDFFENEYRHDPQPDTFVEVDKFWQNFSLNVLAQPRVNDFYETVERLPDVRLTGFRQRLGNSPFYYQSESSAGYYRRLFAETNGAPAGLNFEATRADTYQQVTMPETYFGWLNITPRMGGRFTYYGEAHDSGATTEEASRSIFATGAEASFKLSRVWPGIRSGVLDLDGFRHIIEPSANYMFVPRPNYRPGELPQFDYELPSLRLLPFEFPEYNSIDSIDSQNVIRFGLRNKLQTKRDGQLEDLLRWELFTDWRMRPRTNQTTFSDL